MSQQQMIVSVTSQHHNDDAALPVSARIVAFAANFAISVLFSDSGLAVKMAKLELQPAL